MNVAKVFLGSGKDLAASVDVPLLEIAPIAIGLASTVELLEYKSIECGCVTQVHLTELSIGLRKIQG